MDYQDPKSVKYTLEDKLYLEYNKEGKVTYSRRLRHAQAVRFEETSYGVYEYDECDRLLFGLSKSSGFWSMCFFHAPTTDKNGHTKVDNMPHSVMHKWWDLYNGL